MSGKISQDPDIGTVVGNELIPVVSGGVNKRTTPAEILSCLVPSSKSGMNLVFSGTDQTAAESAYFWRGTVSGSVNNTQPVAANVFQADGFNVTTTGNISCNTRVYTNLGGAGQVGAFCGLGSEVFVYAPTGNLPGSGRFYSAGAANAHASTGDNGTVGSPSGSLNGFNSNATLDATASNWLQVIGTETDIRIGTGCSANFIVGTSTVLLNGNTVAASVENLGFMVAAQSGATATLDCAYAIGTYQGFNPIAAAGSIMAFKPHLGVGSGPTITNGIDLSLFTFTGTAFKSNAFSIDGSGNASVATLNSSAGNITANGSIIVASGASRFLYALANQNGAFPSTASAGAAIGWNFSAGGAEVDFWNTATGVSGTNSFYFQQMTGVGTATSLAQLGPSGFNLLQGVLTVQGGANALLTSSSAITSGAGASTGTLTNAPAAGNPTKWIKINDNGTNRFIPAW